MVEKFKPERVLSFRVTHPDHPPQLVSLINPPRDDIFALSTKEAARRWDVPWGKVVNDCRADPFEESWNCFCRICKRKFISLKIAEECDPCIDKRRKAALDYAKRHPVDRRINADL